MEDVVYYCKKCKRFVPTGSSSISGDPITEVFCLRCFRILFRWKYGDD